MNRTDQEIILASEQPLQQILRLETIAPQEQLLMVVHLAEVTAGLHIPTETILETQTEVIVDIRLRIEITLDLTQIEAIMNIHLTVLRQVPLTEIQIPHQVGRTITAHLQQEDLIVALQAQTEVLQVEQLQRQKAIPHTIVTDLLVEEVLRVDQVAVLHLEEAQVGLREAAVHLVTVAVDKINLISIINNKFL